MNSKEMWNKWKPDIHNSADSQKRIISAQKADLTPIRLEKEDGMAYFQGAHGRYETFLDYCPCGDFHRRNLPCKHIYRLAMELHLIDGHPVSDAAKVKVPKVKDGYELISALDIIESCSDEAQNIIYHLLSSIRDGSYQELFEKSPAASELIDKNICYAVENDVLKSQFLNYRKLVEMLKNAGFDVGIRKTPHEQTLQLAMSNFPDYIKDEYSKTIVLTIHDSFSKVKSKLYTYFKRKFDPQMQYDTEMNVVAFYPNDEITALLISRGILKKED